MLGILKSGNFLKSSTFRILINVLRKKKTIFRSHKKFIANLYLEQCWKTGTKTVERATPSFPVE